MRITHISSSETRQMEYREIAAGNAGQDALNLTGEKRQTVQGFGGCFNELGWDALAKADKTAADGFIKELFGKDGCRFNTGRVPIGANDFSLEWYSCDDVDGDYALEHFNIERDKAHTIPFVKAAIRHNPALCLFASPWSPPIWMKTKKSYNYGRIRMEPEVLDAYARYFLRFVQAYAAEGVKVDQVHIQNEPMADQKFPSCLWYGEDMRLFIADYIGPVFENAGMPAEIWLGTINGPFVDFRGFGMGAPFHQYYDQFANAILSDPVTRKYITGVGAQWGGKHQLEQIVASYPHLRIMQTESECGDGKNEWEQAEYIFTQMWYYFRHGAERYVYWNMALPSGGESTWGWRQNSLCTVDTSTGALTLQPEYYLMKHFSGFVDPGARVLTTGGIWTSNTVAFENPDGSKVIVLGNSMTKEREFSLNFGDGGFTAQIEPRSFNTFVVNA